MTEIDLDRIEKAAKDLVGLARDGLKFGQIYVVGDAWSSAMGHTPTTVLALVERVREAEAHADAMVERAAGFEMRARRAEEHAGGLRENDMVGSDVAWALREILKAGLPIDDAYSALMHVVNLMREDGQPFLLSTLYEEVEAAPEKDRIRWMVGKFGSDGCRVVQILTSGKVRQS